MSTSAAHRWVPCGKENVDGSKVASESSVGSIPSGRLCAAKTASAQSATVLAASGVTPHPERAVGELEVVGGALEHVRGDRRFALSRTFSQAITRAMPPTASEREP